MNHLDIKKLAYQCQDYMVRMRRAFHEHPEISGKEFHTRQVLIHELDAMQVPYQLLDGTGIIATIQGGKPGKHRVLRADIDGLPLQEDAENLKQKKVCMSHEDGACHACGHDAHMAVLLGTMKVLLELQDQIEGTVYCCFEEGEETGCGIDTMLKALEEYSVDECFALHVYANLDAGKINIVPGPRMAGTVGISFHIKGKTGHGSRPDCAINPIVPGIHILSEIDSAFRNQINAEETVTLSPCVFQAGEQWNVIPESAFISGGARYFNKAEGEKAFQIINNVAEHVAACHRCTVSYDPFHRIILQPVVNDPKVVARICAKLRDCCGDEVFSDCDRWYASETYSKFLERYPGALGLLGIRNDTYGSGAAHHNEKFDIDESALPLGVCAEVSFVFS